MTKGLPIFVSECAGMEASGDGAVNTEEWDAWKQWMEKHQTSWVAWSVSSKTETCSMIVADDQPGTQSAPISNWTESDLKEWGKTVRNELQNNVRP
jgi:endoglucanase